MALTSPTSEGRKHAAANRDAIEKALAEAPAKISTKPAQDDKVSSDESFKNAVVTPETTPLKQDTQNKNNESDEDLEFKHLRTTYISTAMNVPMTLAAVLCTTFVDDDYILNLNINQAAPQLPTLMDLMLSFTEKGNRMKSINSDKLYGYLCSKLRLDDQNIPKHVSYIEHKYCLNEDLFQFLVLDRRAK